MPSPAVMHDQLKWIERHLASQNVHFSKNEPLSEHTTFRIGGPTDIFCIVSQVDQLKSVVALCRESGVPFFLLGGGSNVLVADAGFRGVTIKNKTAELRINDNFITVDSGYPMPKLAGDAAAKNLTGAEFLRAIPGTIGGGIHENARFRSPQDFNAYDGLARTRGCDQYVGSLVEEVMVLLPDNRVIQLANADCAFTYEGFTHSSFQNNNDIILRATLRLQPDDPNAIHARMRTITQWRMSRTAMIENKPLSQPNDPFTGIVTGQPVGASAGCVFFNVPNSFDHPTGRLIDLCGLRGHRLGDAQISERHANYIINLGSARASDVRALMDLSKERVRARFGIELVEEIAFIGEW